MAIAIRHFSRLMGKQTFWFPTRSDTNQAVQLQKMTRGLKFRNQKVVGLYYLCALISFVVDAKLICAFLFAYMQNVGFLMTWHNFLLTGAKLRRSNRRLDALSMRRIQQDLLIPCGCKRQCNTQFSAHDVLMWRQKIHKESQGAKRNTVLIDVIRQCSTSYGHVKHQLFKVHEKIVCR